MPERPRKLNEQKTICNQGAHQRYKGAARDRDELEVNAD